MEEVELALAIGFQKILFYSRSTILTLDPAIAAAIRCQPASCFLHTTIEISVPSRVLVPPVFWVAKEKYLFVSSYTLF